MPSLSSRNLRNRAKRLAKTELRHFWHKAPVRNDTVLYESFSGNGMLCQPEAIFRFLISEPKFNRLNHIWVLNDFERYADVVEEFKGYANVRFVKYLSNGYYRALSTSKFLINNVSFPTQFVKRSEQVYLNTWHGIPLKKMGYDIPKKGVEAKNIVRNFLCADYLISSSPAMTDEMYMRAFKMQNIFEGKIIEEGNPRIDRQFDVCAARQEFDAHLEKAGILTDERQIILYAPTWKGESYFSPHNDGAGLKALVSKLENKIDGSKYRVMLKAHQVVSEAVGRIKELKNYLVPNSIPTNVALGATDILITDYSSIYYDFLVQDKPVIFYIPDLEDYKRYRDLYTSPEDLPGPIARNSEELVRLVSSVNNLSDLDQQRRTQFELTKDRYVPFEDGGVSARIADIVIMGQEDGYRIKSEHSDGRKKILIYAGGMIPNGITTSALNLLDNIDYEKFDVTVLCPFSTKSEIQHNFQQVNSQARVMFRFGSFNGGYLNNSIRLRILRKGASHWASKSKSQEKLWTQEWNRCFGQARFDHMIDFSGYTSFWGTLFLHGPAERRSIWLHNDLAADAHRSIEGSQPLKKGLYSTFSIYRYFDNLVSVSQGLNEINKKSLTKWSSKANFCYASNTVNARKIREMASIRIRSAKVKVTQRDLADPKLRSAIMGKQVAELLDPELLMSDDFSADLQEHMTSEPFFTYFSAGRLSPEKNHSRLIQAFSLVHENIPTTRLVIAGEGPLRDQLENEIVSLGLTESVKLVGHTKNPYRLMNFADAFVLSSDYEGQPMVLLEALVLGIPVITTSFGSVAGALPPNIGTIVPPRVEDLAEAMCAEAANPTSRIDFDIDEYNRRAISEFENILG